MANLTREQLLDRKAKNLAWKIVINGDVSTDLSGSDISMLEGFRDFFEEAADDCDSFFHDLNTRTDISDDDRMELQGFEELIGKYVNVYEILMEELR